MGLAHSSFAFCEKHNFEIKKVNKKNKEIEEKIK